MLRRIRRRLKFNIFPLLLSVILLFTFSIHTGVFSPKPARAAVIADDIITAGAIVAWLSAAGIAIGAQLAGDNATQEQAAAFMRDLCKQYETAKNLAVGFVFNQIAGAINDTVIFVDEVAVKPAIQFGHEIWGLLSDVTDWCVDTFDLIPNQVVASVLYSHSGLFFDNGAEFQYSTDDYEGGTLIAADTTYTSASGNKFILTLYNSNHIRITNPVTGVLYKEQSITNANWSSVTGLRISSRASGASNTWCRYYGFNTSDVAKTLTTGFPASTLTDMFGGSTTAQLDGLGKDLLPSLDYENADENDAVWVFPDTDVVNLPSTGSLESDVFGGFLDGARDGSLVDAQTNAATRVIAQEGTAPVEPNPDIPTYELPLIGINFPANWSLNLHGIWHYVRTWVSSIASFINWIFGVYSNLPYAMVVPIYAAAVIVIVLGIYKRFFM